MKHKPYPWQAVETVRQSDENAAQQIHAELAAQLEGTRAELKQLMVAQQRTRDQLRAAVVALTVPDFGCLAGELQQRSAYLDSLRAQARRLAESIRNAENHLRDARAQLERARANLYNAHAGKKQIERHRDGFEIAQRKQGEQRAELEAEEQQLARRGR